MHNVKDDTQVCFQHLSVTNPDAYAKTMNW